MKTKFTPLLVLCVLTGWIFPVNVFARSTMGTNQPMQGTTQLFLPLLAKGSPQATSAFRVNVPQLSGDINLDANFSQTAVFWFGSVSSNTDYTDVRIGYNATELWINLNVLDRTLWYDPTHKISDLTNWDGATLYLDLDGPIRPSISSQSFRFDSQLNDYEQRPAWQAAYSGSSGSWTLAMAPFTTNDGIAWGSVSSGGLNNNTDNRGWTMTYRIPFSTLGLSAAPAAGSNWGISLALHNRNSQAGPPLADTVWPPAARPLQPSTWAQLHFGIPDQPSPKGTPVQTVTIRRDPTLGLDVPDAGVGGTIPSLCPGDLTYIWNAWGTTNFGAQPDFNIQNQSNISDWPCFSKYYVTFPTSPVPANKVILSATLVLHQYGGAGSPGQALPSLIQVSTVSPDWSENTITWNNAPIPYENVSSAWVDVPSNYGTWPMVARQWNVTSAAIQAYAAGKPLSLALYEADSAFHSGKYFTSSDTGSWNLQGRPTLLITWGNP